MKLKEVLAKYNGKYIAVGVYEYHDERPDYFFVEGRWFLNQKPDMEQKVECYEIIDKMLHVKLASDSEGG